MKKSKGMSLIVLCVTLAVMVTIAITIVIAITNSGTITKAKEASLAANISAAQTEVTSKYYDWVSVHLDEDFSEANIPELGVNLSDYGIQNLAAIGIDATGVPEVYETVAGEDWRNTYENEFGNEINVNVQKNVSGYAYNNPVIPAGFKPINTSEASWNNLNTDWNKGLVIEDEHGNQYVWVPVKDGVATTTESCDDYDVSNDVRYEFWYSLFSSESDLTCGDISDDRAYWDFQTNAPRLDRDQTTQVSTYGGFYIGRYEASFDYNGGGADNIRIGSKKGIGVLNSIIEIDWLTASEATGYTMGNGSSQFYQEYIEASDERWGYDTTKVQTMLPTGTMWSTVAKWLQVSGKDVMGYYGTRMNWGNVVDAVAPANVEGYGTMKPSGFSEMWKANNIYDLLGNQLELVDCPMIAYASQVCGVGGCTAYGSLYYPYIGGTYTNIERNRLQSFGGAGFRPMQYIDGFKYGTGAVYEPGDPNDIIKHGLDYFILDSQSGLPYMGARVALFIL